MDGMASALPYDCALIAWLVPSGNRSCDRFEDILQRAASSMSTEALDRQLALCGTEKDIYEVCRCGKLSGAKLTWCTATLLLCRLGGNNSAEKCSPVRKCPLGRTLRSTVERVYCDLLGDGVLEEAIVEEIWKVLCCVYVNRRYQGEVTVRSCIATCKIMLPLLPCGGFHGELPRIVGRLRKVSTVELADISVAVQRLLPAERLEAATTLQQLVDEVTACLSTTD